GLSMVTKLAPSHMSGTLMGGWFLSFSGSNYLAGQLAKLTGANSSSAVDTADITEVIPAALPSAGESLARYIDVYTVFGLIAVGVGLFVLIISPKLNKLMHGIR
ncbi:MAG TPA: hypothetical protein VKX35_03075, partial [Fermentimonas sp.]|nr:hypothetical protein [Fermentimonas sp.]